MIGDLKEGKDWEKATKIIFSDVEVKIENIKVCS